MRVNSNKTNKVKRGTAKCYLTEQLIRIPSSSRAPEYRLILQNIVFRLLDISLHDHAILLKYLLIYLLVCG